MAEYLVYVAHFFAGILLANGIPHFTQGIAGNRFPTPFGQPRGVGESSPRTNVFWGLANFAAACLLVRGIGDSCTHTCGGHLAVAAGFSVGAILLSGYFDRVRSSKK